MIDVDECMSIDCGMDGECTNTLGSFTCDCDPGYVANKSNICVGRCNTEIVNGVACQGNSYSVFWSKIILHRPMSYVTLCELLNRHSALSQGPHAFDWSDY